MGYGELEAMLSGTPGGRGAITPEAAEKAVKNLIMGLWLQDKCERYEDTAKFLSLVDFFLPYFPLERPHVAVLMRGALAEWAAKLAAQHPGAALTWNDDVVDFLVDRVDFDGPYPLEGAKQVGNVATRYIARLVRRYAPPAAGSASSAAGGAAGSAAAPAAARLSSLLKHASSSSPSALSEQQRVQKVRLEIAPNGKELKLV